ncbi:DUF2968 domain-containing protein [Caballeronia sp. LZ062]|uniref:DUF2968 domain-containing protein n=1 Tax=unclassified Caballeronia TaxID=2646786 RepID=UPI002855F831|nr:MULTISPECIES: DUF2968 domain-containing protein [unclassified Caballeronia]MDR5856874.1 DUF2968 domain-containing protein [Caballeronia sp. LZ050]MDR5869729.1 DUF2968 domain-containing protein [Caballeronia sp. LZ062]
MLWLGLCAPASQAQSGRASDSPDNAASANGDIAELEALTRDGKITTLRKAVNGSYGASLAYYREQVTYYAALFQVDKSWRVVKTQNEARAESVFADFAKTSVSLADAEIRRIKLEAETAYAQRLIAAQQARASRLQADLNVAHAQQSEVANHQQAEQDAIRQLRTEQAAAQAQLRALQLRVQELQKQADGDLPASGK